MNSLIYSGRVMHARNHPVTHRFEYPILFYAIDIDELPEISRVVKGFGASPGLPVRLRPADYLGKEGSLREKIERYAQPFIPHRIILITVARFLTPVFNPVNFFYLLNEENEPEQMLIEVNNTFRQRHVYMTASTRKYPIQTQFKKEFHVSPFNDMSGEYEASFSPPDENLRISIKLMHEERCILDTALWGQGEPLSTRSLWKHIARHPFSAALTMPRIYYQAAQLYWRKKLSIFPTPSPTHPHTSWRNS